MADRTVENSSEEVPEIPEMLENVLLFALDEAKEKMEEGAELVPFTTLVVKENLFIESHPGDSSEECYNLAQHTVEGARGAERRYHRGGRCAGRGGRLCGWLPLYRR